MHNTACTTQSVTETTFIEFGTLRRVSQSGWMVLMSVLNAIDLQILQQCTIDNAYKHWGSAIAKYGGAIGAVQPLVLLIGLQVGLQSTESRVRKTTYQSLISLNTEYSPV